MTRIAHQFSCQHSVRSTPFVLGTSNPGYRMLVKGGWNKESGLGSREQGVRQPVRTVLKHDRLGVGADQGTKRARVTHFKAGDEGAVRAAPQIARPKSIRQQKAETASKERGLRSLLDFDK